ncbi:MAG TPA: hypothetical protein VFW65_20870 [Pseudonocardiaceae bacterium]|nr:hypothetical protein [Pseudonocardiaceae bacterium]
MLVRFAYLAVVQAFAALRLLPMADRERDVEILALRRQVAILQRQLGDQCPRLRPADRWFLAAFGAAVPRDAAPAAFAGQLDTVLRWHRDLVKRRYTRAS